MELELAQGCITAMVTTPTGLERDAAAMKTTKEGRIPGFNCSPRAYNTYEQQVTIAKVIEKLEAN